MDERTDGWIDGHSMEGYLMDEQMDIQMDIRWMDEQLDR